MHPGGSGFRCEQCLWMLTLPHSLWAEELGTCGG